MMKNINRRIKVVLPSFVTLTSLFFGFYAIVVCISVAEIAYQNLSAYDKTLAVGRLVALAGACIITGSILDMFDGSMARHFGVSSELGKNLDSLSDFVTFGVAPGILFFVTVSFTDQGPFGIALYKSSPWLEQIFSLHLFSLFLAFIVPFCAVYRLAKYNSMESHGNYFVGIPSTFAGSSIAISFAFNYQGTLGGHILNKLGFFEVCPWASDIAIFFKSFFSSYPTLVLIYVLLGVFMVVRVRYVRMGDFFRIFCKNRASYFILFLLVIFFFKYIAVITAFLYFFHPFFLSRFVEYRESR